MVGLPVEGGGGWRRAWAGRRMEERRRGDSVALEAMEMVERESV